MRINKLRLLLAAGSVTIVAASVVVVASGAQQRTLSPRSKPALQSAAAVYAVFEPTRQPPANTPARARAEASVRRHVVPHRDQTRLLTSSRDVRAYGLTDDKAVCIYVEKALTPTAEREWGAAACAMLNDIRTADHPITSTTYAGGGAYQFSALVPNGIEDLHIETSAGSRDVDVVGNAVSLELASKPTSVSWHAGNGTEDSDEPWSDG